MEKDNIEQALKTLMERLVEQANLERKESESYKNLFSEARGDSIEGLLRKAEMQMTGIALDVLQVIEDKFGKKLNRDQFNILLALPFVEETLTNYIRDKEGSACCVDKTYYLLDKLFLNK